MQKLHETQLSVISLFYVAIILDFIMQKTLDEPNRSYVYGKRLIQIASKDTTDDKLQFAYNTFDLHVSPKFVKV